MGRINIKMEYSGEYVELDHWANWFFHIFMGTDKNHYTYAKAPQVGNGTVTGTGACL